MAAPTGGLAAPPAKASAAAKPPSTAGLAAAPLGAAFAGTAMARAASAGVKARLWLEYERAASAKGPRLLRIAYGPSNRRASPTHIV